MKEAQHRRTAGVAVKVENLRAWYGNHEVLKGVTFTAPPNRITAIIGPSGCGKSTLVRCINRLHELVPHARVSGKILLDGEDIYASGTDPVPVRRRVGMVFQRPNPFPMMTVFENVAAGLRLNGTRDGNKVTQTVEESLKKAALWDEVMGQLHQSGTALSGGQQQRLCIARALAVQPQVLLFDEPTSALDPVATEKIESLLQELKRQYTIVIVTHNMQQAARIADFTAFLYLGELVEFEETEKMFTNPSDPRTEAYITGRYG